MDLLIKTNVDFDESPLMYEVYTAVILVVSVDFFKKE